MLNKALNSSISKQRFRLPLIILAISLLITMLTSLVTGLGLLAPFQLKAYDGLFYLRAKLNARPPGYELSRKYMGRKYFRESAFGNVPIVLITIDDETLKSHELMAPTILWHEEYAAIINALARGDARVIGLTNLLPQNDFDKVMPGYSQVWLNSLRYARRHGAQVVSDVRVFSHRRLRPAEIYLQELGPDRVGFFYRNSDFDDFIRRQQIWRMDPATNGESRLEYSFAYLLAHLWEPYVITVPPPKSLPDTIYVDYDPSANPFPKFSFIEVYRQAVANNLNFFKYNFGGRLVLIGNDDYLDSNAWPTPLYHLASDDSRRATTYLELTAHTVSTLLRQSFTVELRNWGCWAIYLLLSFLPLLTVGKTRHRFRMMVLSWALALIYPIICLLAFYFNILLPLVSGLLALFCSFSVCLLWHFLNLEHERIFTRQVFYHYLSPGVVEEVLKNPEALTVGGIRREMTAFFSDFVSFTSLAEKMQPDDLVNLLNVYFSRMTKSVFNWGGTLDKFIGDSFMAFWGAPLVDPNHAARACLSALEQQRALLDLRSTQLRSGRPVLTALMGLNTGNMAVGNIGTQERLSYSVIGDAVNLASRLVVLNKVYGTQIIISESTALAAADEIEARRLDHVRVFGRAESLVIYELMAERGQLGHTSLQARAYYEEGLEFYLVGKFKKACDLLTKALAIKPGDRPSLIIFDRCRAMLAKPPVNWNGITNYHDKYANY